MIVMSLPEIPQTYLSFGFNGVHVVVLPFAFTTISDGNENLSMSPVIIGIIVLIVKLYGLLTPFTVLSRVRLN